ncbi:MAG: response regulator [Campylobacterales bacterium]
MKVVVVDDSTLIRAIFKTNLGRFKSITHIIEAIDGRHALQILSTNTDTKLLITDLKMPNLVGVELIKKLRANPKLAKIKVVVISSEINESVMSELRSLGVRDFVQKPFNLQNFLDVIGPIIQELERDGGSTMLTPEQTRELFATQKPNIKVANGAIEFDFSDYILKVAPEVIAQNAEIKMRLDGMTAQAKRVEVSSQEEEQHPLDG